MAIRSGVAAPAQVNSQEVTEVFPAGLARIGPRMYEQPCGNTKPIGVGAAVAAAIVGGAGVIAGDAAGVGGATVTGELHAASIPARTRHHKVPFINSCRFSGCSHLHHAPHCVRLRDRFVQRAASGPCPLVHSPAGSARRHAFLDFAGKLLLCREPDLNRRHMVLQIKVQPVERLSAARFWLVRRGTCA